jgi:mono/diheme cytochrome c family protein
MRFCICFLVTICLHSICLANPLTVFQENLSWTAISEARVEGGQIKVSSKSGEPPAVIYNGASWEKSTPLASMEFFEDVLVNMECLIPAGSRVSLYMQGCYPVELNGKSDQWHRYEIKFRGARFDEARKRIENAILLEMRVDGEMAQEDVVFLEPSPEAPIKYEDQFVQMHFVANQGPMAIRNFSAVATDFGAVKWTGGVGSLTNKADLIDLVAQGRELFVSMGCNVCHGIKHPDTAVFTGPNLYNLFTKSPRERVIAEGPDQLRFNVKVDKNYLRSSLRTPNAQLAVAETGSQKGEPYQAIMPPYPEEALSDLQIDAIGSYLATLSEPHLQGPVIKLADSEPEEPYDPMTDSTQLLVAQRTRIQRGPMDHLSGSAIHVGQVGGVSFSFDPRILAVAKVWQGGFLDVAGEFKKRGGKGFNAGYESREIRLGSRPYLLAPLDAKGELLDFSFKNPKFGDVETLRKLVHSDQNYMDLWAQVGAQFLGYEVDSTDDRATPVFQYRVGENFIGVRTVIEPDGETLFEITGTLATPQSFSINTNVLKKIKTDAGKYADKVWTLPPGEVKARLRAGMNLGGDTWKAPPSDFHHAVQGVVVAPSAAEMPKGYKIENYYPPKDNYGREQLFEAVGLEVAADGTIVVVTRTAGIWRMVKGQWKLFAEGTFDALGVVIEDREGLQIVVGQKPELTRIKDVNGDGLADKYETLFDVHRFSGNYHSYMHGPVRGPDGAYYININLADGDDGYAYKARGSYLGAIGGFSGWCMRVEADGQFEPWAFGMRSPAGIGLAPDGQLWYAENQGEYVATSKIFVLKYLGFYGHPSSLIDLPGMTPNSDEIQWEKVASKRQPAVILLPHNKLANSPGHPVWDTTGGKFGPYEGQMLIGDQTQSNLMRVSVETVNGSQQGSVMPFIQGLESGVVRPLFLTDGSLLLGQTGRGWRAKGGKVASLQRITWQGEAVSPAIFAVKAVREGFKFQLTQPLKKDVTAAELNEWLRVKSWVYRDAPAYGSDELDLCEEVIKSFSISEDRKEVSLQLATLQHDPVHPQQTARVYHFTLAAESLFEMEAPAKMEAYYTLYSFPE